MATSDGGKTWKQVKQGEGGNAISCPTARVCFAASLNDFLTTSNGGKTWSSYVSSSVAVQPGSSISCPGVETCIAAGRGLGGATSGIGIVLSTSNGGRTWTSHVPDVSLTAFSCASTSFCIGVGQGGAITVTAFDGMRWKDLSHGAAMQSASGQTGYLNLTGISCPIPSTCFAADFGSIWSTTDSGHTWVSRNIPANVNAISCANATTCIAVGQHAVATMDGGRTWTQQSLPGGGNGISCPSVTTCYVVGSGGILATTSGGATWTLQHDDAGGELDSVSCPTVAICYAVGGVYNPYDRTAPYFVLTTTNGGNTWSKHALGTGWAVSRVSCSSGTSCLEAHGSAITATSDGGATWVTADTIQAPITASFTGITCLATGVCYAVESTGTIVHTADGGRTWGVLDSGTTNALTGIACAAPQACYVIGDGNTILSNVSP